MPSAFSLALIYGRNTDVVGAPPGDDLFYRTSMDDSETWSEEQRINAPGVTASSYHDTLTQLDSGRLVSVAWCYPFVG